MDMKRVVTLFILPALTFALTACSADALAPNPVEPTSQPATGLGEQVGATVNTQQNPVITSSPISVEYDRDDLDSSASGSNMSYIALEGDSISFEGRGASVNGSIVTIWSGGMYSISGTLHDGQIIVDTQDLDTVVLVLNGVDITSFTSAAIFVSNAEKTVITLADGTENRVTDGTAYVFEGAEDEPNAAVFSKDDLTINGSGSLTVNANYNNGIASKDDLRIISGSITVSAVNDGIKGRDSIAVRDGVITVDAGGDGMQANNDEDVERGYVTIEGGTLNIVAGLDGIQAETRLALSGGDIAVVSGGGNTGGSSGSTWPVPGLENDTGESDSTESAKGLKAGLDITITGGVVNINSLDDAVHSNDSITIAGGDLLLASGDDAIHSDSTLTISGGDLNITQSYEGMESAVITIDGGTIHIVSTDDGINTSSGDGGGDMGGPPMPGQAPPGFEAGDHYLYINGGYVAIDAMGDGIDANGPIEMTGGTVIVNGPTSNNNGALDYTGAFNITGGLLVAVGSSGMAQAPSASSTQYSVMHTFPTSQPAGTLVHLETEDGREILTLEPTKAYQSVLVSSPKLQNGSTVVVYSGGSSTGTVTGSLYSGGAYTPGTQVASLTISSIVTGAGPSRGGLPGGGRGRRGG